MKQDMLKPLSPKSYFFLISSIKSIFTFKTQNLEWNLIHLTLNPSQLSCYNDTTSIILSFLLTCFYMEKLRKQSEEVRDEIKPNEISHI